MIAENTSKIKIGIITLDSTHFAPFNAFEFAMRAMCKEGKRYAIDRILVKVKDGKAECIGTDGYRLHIGRCEYFPIESDGEYIFKVLSKSKKQIIIEHVIDVRFPEVNGVIDDCCLKVEYKTSVGKTKNLLSSILTWITGELFDSNIVSESWLNNEKFSVSLSRRNRNDSMSPAKITYDNGFEAIIMPCSM